MKHPIRSHILPLFPLGAGGLGFILQLWLFSATDEKGLLPAGHFASSAAFILTALVLGILFLATRELTPRPVRKGFLRLTAVGANVLGGLGLLIYAVTALVSGNARFSILAAVAGFAGFLLLMLIAWLNFTHKRAPYWLWAPLTVALMLCTVSQCQIWGAEPQLQVYCFPLLASVFLILTAYHKTRLAAGQGNLRHLAFFSQGALFLCCLSLTDTHWLLYFGMLFWAAVQIFPCIRTKKEA